MTDIVFGGGQGIGLSIVRKLQAMANDKVFVVDRFIPEQMKDDSDLFGFEQQRFPDNGWEFDHPVTNAFITFGAPSHRQFNGTDVGKEMELMRLNFHAVTSALRSIKPKLDSYGSIVITTTVSASRADQGGVIYASAKAGLEALVRGLAREWAPIRVNGIAPGPTGTENFLKNVPVENRILEVGRSPHNRLIEPDEVADAAIALSMLTAVSGVILPVDLAGLSSSRRWG